jgi:hypothetical protein
MTQASLADSKCRERKKTNDIYRRGAFDGGVVHCLKLTCNAVGPCSVEKIRARREPRPTRVQKDSRHSDGGRPESRRWEAQKQVNQHGKNLKLILVPLAAVKCR